MNKKYEQLRARVLKRAKKLAIDQLPDAVYEMLDQYNATYELTAYSRNKLIESVCLECGLERNGDSMQFRYYDPRYNTDQDIRVETDLATGIKKYEYIAFHGYSTPVNTVDEMQLEYVQFFTTDPESGYYKEREVEQNGLRIEYFTKYKYESVPVRVPEYFIQIMSDFGLTPQEVLEQFVNDMMQNRYSQGSDERLKAQDWFRRSNISHRIGLEEGEAILDFYVFDRA